jgi:hypothetical protein
MNIFDTSGVVLIAVDDKFTLEDPDGLEVQKDCVQRQFLNRYYNEESGYKSVIKNAVARRGTDTEIHIPIGDKIFVLFAYTSQGDEKDYVKPMDYRRALLKIPGSVKKALQYCNQNFPGEIVHTVPIGMGVENDRTPNTSKGYVNTLDDTKENLHALAKSLDMAVEIVEIEDETPLMGEMSLHVSIK